MSRILIIDDDKSISKMLSNLVGQMGHEATSRHTLATGLDEMVVGAYDVVLLDVQLPDGSGLDILPQIRKSPSNPEVIIMTGYGSVDGAEIAIKNGAWDYIQKTDSPQKIILPLKRVIQYRNEVQKVRPAAVALKLEGIIGNSSPMRACFNLLAQAASGMANVLLSGETGTGKELFARAIHENSERCRRNFVVVDCAALPETLVESLLFGHKKGAYTGADASRDGLMTQADGGTLFLDEVGELPAQLQKVFLRVLQEHRFRPVGGKKEIQSEFRLIAASNKDLDTMVANDLFRSDLLYRLKTLTITLPPLRKRLEDIVQLVLYHSARLCRRQGVATKGYSPEFFETLSEYTWPGNVRELINTIEMSLSAAGPEQMLFPRHLPDHIRIKAAQTSLMQNQPVGLKPENISPPSDTLPLFKDYKKLAVQKAEKAYMEKLKTLCAGNVRDACRTSGLSRSRLYDLLKCHGLSIQND